MATFKVGDIVTMTRMPISEDWNGIGEIDIPAYIMDNPNIVTNIGKATDAVSFENTGYYPASCFKLHDIEETNHEQAQVGDHIQILNTVGAMWLRSGHTYLVEDVDRPNGKIKIGGQFWSCHSSDYRIVTSQAGEPTFDQEAIDRQKEKLKRSLLIYKAKEDYPPGTKFTNKQGSISVISDTPEYTHSSSKDGIYARTVTGKLVYIYYEGKWYDIVKGEPIVTSTPRARLKAGDRIYIKSCAEGTAARYRNSVVKVAYDPYYYGDGSYHITVTHDPKVGFLLNTHEWEHDTTPTTEEEHMFKVGDIVVGLPSANTKYNVTKEGWKGVITEIHNKLYMTVRGIKEAGIYTVKKDHFELTDSYTEEELFYPKLKTNTNGTESNKTVKLQGINLQIREGNSIRGIGLKGSGSKIKLGGDYSHY